MTSLFAAPVLMVIIILDLSRDWTLPCRLDCLGVFAFFFWALNWNARTPNSATRQSTRKTDRHILIFSFPPEPGRPVFGDWRQGSAQVYINSRPPVKKNYGLRAGSFGRCAGSRVRCRDNERLFQAERIAGFANIESVARRRLDALGETALRLGRYSGPRPKCGS